MSDADQYAFSGPDTTIVWERVSGFLFSKARGGLRSPRGCRATASHRAGRVENLLAVRIGHRIKPRDLAPPLRLASDAATLSETENGSVGDRASFDCGRRRLDQRAEW
jgi:hypothetical protein